MTPFVAEHKKRPVHRLLLEHQTGYRHHPINALFEIDRLVHDQHLRLCGDLNHRASPIPHSDDSKPSISCVGVKIRSFKPVTVSTSAIGQGVADGAGISNLEKTGVANAQRAFVLLPLSTRREISRFVARATPVIPWT
jgi:hypothetical protein